MRFSVGYPVAAVRAETIDSYEAGYHPANPEFFTHEFAAEFISQAADSGFSSVHFTEHPAPSDRWLATGGHEALDPFVGLGFIAALNSDLRLLTCLSVLPYRNPFVMAKAVATLDRLSAGRVTLGVGTGYLKSKFFALGVDFEERNALFDEALDVCRLVWTGKPMSYEGRHFSARDVRCLPTPVQDPLPIWIGGKLQAVAAQSSRKSRGMDAAAQPDLDSRCAPYRSSKKSGGPRNQGRPLAPHTGSFDAQYGLGSRQLRSRREAAMNNFPLAIPDEVLDDLRTRLNSARLPNEIRGAGWTMGTDLGYMRELIAYWRDDFDWRAQEQRFAQLDHRVTEIDGQPIHFATQGSGRPGALPLLLLHGWPGSFVEFLDAAELLTAAAKHGLSFDVILPSLPGYGYSGPTREPGWHPRRIAQALIQLMDSLGYSRYGVQGGDWGSIVAANMADLAPDRVVGLHVNFLTAPRPDGQRTADLPSQEREDIEAIRRWQEEETGYSAIQRTRPQSIGYALEDSPVGLAAWIVEKFRAWSDCNGEIERSFSKDQLLTNITLYWVTATATSSARLYHEMRKAGAAAVPQAPVRVPTGVANYPAEVTKIPRAWAERRYNVTHWVNLPRGGHFAAMEVPEIFAADVRGFFQSVL